jgi:phosphoserine phosphatase
MGGSVLFEVALQARLDLIRPSRAQVDQIAVEGQLHLTPRIDELVARLLELGKRVCLVSGGFRQMIAPVAARLGIDSSCVFANQLLFDNDGAYAGFDATEFTSRSGGKGRAIEHIQKAFGCARVVMIGDGATDLEARPPADIFIGFGGIVEREAVRLGADWFVRSFDDLIHELSEARSVGYTAASVDDLKLGILHGVGSSHSCRAVDQSRSDLECTTALPAELGGGGASA